MIYHYCSNESFFKIIKSNSIWACDLTKTNDPDELSLGFNVIKPLWDKILPEKSQSFSEGLFESTKGIPLSTSFSKNKDLLSQWRAYADDGSGVSIGVSEDSLIQANMKQYQVVDESGETSVRELKPQFRIQEVFYCEREFSNYVEDKLVRFREKNLDWIQGKAKGSKASQVFFAQTMYTEASLFKSEFYKEEQEVRLIRLLSNPISRFNDGQITVHDCVKMEEFDYYPRGKSLVPYIPIKLNSGQVNALADIILGPKFESSKEEVDMFLSLNSFTNCTIDKSSGRYR